MSLKEFTKEIFTEYGLTEEDIEIYLAYLSLPRPTLSEAYLSMVGMEDENAIEYDKVAEITRKLVDKNFLKKLGGVVERYVPLEPYFELFTTKFAKFEKEAGSIKESVFEDQSQRFENLEKIQNDSISEVETSVSAQINDFFTDSDNKDADKKEKIANALTRFKETTNKLESDLHGLIEAEYSTLTDDVNKNDGDTDSVWDVNSSKFTEDNNALNSELTQIVEVQTSANNAFTSKTHGIIDSLNSDLKNISDSFVSTNENDINTSKENLIKIITDLLEDFSSRISGLENEVKKELDEHVVRHENIANELKPKMEQILEKYLERMDKIVSDLKGLFSKLLSNHLTQIKTTSDNVEIDFKAIIDKRYDELVDQTKSFKNTTLQLIDNLLEHANRFTDFSEDMAKKGMFWLGKKAKYKARHETTIENVLKYTEPMKEGFIRESDDYISATQSTKTNLKQELADVLNREKGSISTETDNLDKEAQETLNAELESLATDLSTEIDTTLKGGIDDCSKTTIKLKDSIEGSFSQHEKDYETAITRHKDDSLRHYTDFDKEIKRKNEDWTRNVNSEVDGRKKDISAEVETQIRNQKEFLEKMTNKNIDHSKTYANDVSDMKQKQRELYDGFLAKVREDFNNSKTEITKKVDDEISVRESESGELETNLNSMLTDHKNKFQDNAKALKDSLSNMIKENTQNTKDAIADFTLKFMNSMDDANELAVSSEKSLNDIFNASNAIKEFSDVTTWHSIGRDALIAAVKDAIYRTKSSIIIVTPVVVPEILQIISEYAFQRKAARFMLTSHWDLAQYGGIIEKMKQLGNIQFRQLSQQGEYYAITRDAEEVILCPHSEDETQMLSIISNHPAYARLYSSFIGPIFQANSRPIK